MPKYQKNLIKILNTEEALATHSFGGELSLFVMFVSTEICVQYQYLTIFLKYDPRGNGTLTIDEWIKLATEEVFKPIL